MAHSAMEILSNIERMVKKGLPTLRIEDVPLDLLHQIAWAAIEVGLLYEDCEIDCDLTENPRVDIALKGLARAAKECS